MNLRIVYRTPHGEELREHLFVGVGRVREQGGRLELWAEGQELSLHPTAYVETARIDFFEADCRAMYAEDSNLADTLGVLPTPPVATPESPLRAAWRGWRRKRHA